MGWGFNTINDQEFLNRAKELLIRAWPKDKDTLMYLVAQSLHEVCLTEREACAKLVIEVGKSAKGGYNNAAFEMAKAIRARAEKK